MSSSQKSSLRSQAVLILWGEVDLDTTDEEDLNDWWTNEHLPERLSLPGFLRARRYFAAGSNKRSRRYMACYEVSSLDTLKSKGYLAALNDPTPRTAMFMPTLASMSRSACSVLHSVNRTELVHEIQGATMAQIVFSMAPSSLQWADFSSDIMSMHPIVSAFHILLRDESATSSGISSKSYDAVRFKERAGTEDSNLMFVVLVEFSCAASLPFVAGVVGEVLERVEESVRSHGAQVISSESYEVLCSLGT